MARRHRAHAAPGAGTGSTGGAPVLSGGHRPHGQPAPHPRSPGKHDRGRWLRGVTITEYWPAPESWFVGRMVSAPGLPGLHHIDWLYSAGGLSMQGEGVGLDGQTYHIESLGDGGWVTATGRPTDPSTGWQAGAPYWRAGGYWLTRARTLTFPLAARRMVGRSRAPLRAAARRQLRGRRLAAAALLSVDRRRSRVDPARQPGVRARVSRRWPRRLVRRRRYRRGDQRASHRCLSAPSGQRVRSGAALRRSAHLRHQAAPLAHH